MLTKFGHDRSNRLSTETHTNTHNLYYIDIIVHHDMFVCFQLKVKATYEGVSTHVVYALVNVTVKRNEFTPQFSQGNYRATLLEYFSLGNSVLQVNATDKDAHVSTLHENSMTLSMA